VAAVRPAFVRVVPGEVEQYGAAAAVVLAHLRFRCQVVGIEHEGRRWWRVSRKDLGREVGMTPKAVLCALRVLGDVVTAKILTPSEDQTLAYCVIDEAAVVTSQFPPTARPDQPIAPEGKALAAEGKGPCPTGQRTVPQGAIPLFPETGEKGENAAAAASAASPQPSPGNQQSGEPPSRYCPGHPDGTSQPCPDCRDARLAAEAWERDHRKRRAARASDRAAAIATCQMCDEYGWRLGPDRVVLDDVPKCNHQPLYAEELR
jgi:hypothetical protein